MPKKLMRKLPQVGARPLCSTIHVALAALDAINSQAVTEVSAESREQLLDTRAKLEDCAKRMPPAKSD